MDEKNPEYSQLITKLNSLEERISSIEGKLGIATPAEFTKEGEHTLPGDQSTRKTTEESSHASFESSIGGYGLALVGNIVLLFGIIFLWQYIHHLGHPLYSFLFGYATVAAIFAAAKYLRRIVAKISYMFALVGQLLLFYFTLHLHYYTDTPVVVNQAAGILLLFVVIANQVYHSIKKKSEIYAGIALTMTFITGVVSDTTYFMLSTAVLTAAGSVYFFFRFGWKTTFIISIFLSFSVFIIWVLKNPGLLDVTNLTMHHICNLYLMACAAAFSMVALFPKKETLSKSFLMSSVLVYGMSFSAVLMFFVFTFFMNSYVILFVAISVFCILFSIILKKFSAWDFSPAFYAMYGFVAISVSAYGLFGLPYVFLLLALQSLLVLAMSLWFRSQMIVGLNAAMFFVLLITYIAISESADVINFSFALVAFLTARFLNLKKQLLKLETNYLRNTYLLVMFIMVLYSLHKALPDQYITLSWTIAAAVFFFFNLVLKNIKYRLMAIFAIISAASRLFLVDLSRISFAYRVIAFLFLALISISISIYYYTRMKGKTGSENPGDKDSI
ncbi:MAG: hypothetical protein NT126_02240 [Bacteroidetes bacterium]|nr:hypothetical protein [Bacteroidota bacterium]